MVDFSGMFPTGIAKLPLPKIITTVKLSLMSVGVYKFIEAFYAITVAKTNVGFSTFILESLLVLCLVLAISVLSTVMCAYLYKHVKKIIT